LRPYSGIALDLDVWLHEDAVIPRVLAASERLRFVLGSEIAEDAGARGIGGSNPRLAMKHSVQLVKIYGLGDVRRNDGVILSKFGDTIDLNS
jgi:hypothetical protein